MRTLVVVGHGMVGHRLVEALRAEDTENSWRVVVLAEEPRQMLRKYTLLP